MKTIIVFGATGLIGAYFSADYSNKYKIIAVGKRNHDGGFFATKGIKYYSVDIAKKSDFDKIIEKDIYAVIHFAGIMPATMNGYHPQDYIDTNLKGTLNVLDFCVERKVDRIIFGQSRADSNYLMGKTPIPSDIVKKFPLTGDHSIYSICKNASVDLIEHYYHQFGLKRFILRFPTIYGYHPNSFFYVNGLRKPIAYKYIIDRAKEGKDVEIWGDPSKAKEIVYVNDATQIVEKAILADIDGGVYNVGRGVAVTLEEQIKGIVEVFSPKDNPSHVIYKPEKPNGREYVNDISKTMKELGYIPQYDYCKLLVAYKEEMKSQRFQLLWGVESDYE